MASGGPILFWKWDWKKKLAWYKEAKETRFYYLLKQLLVLKHMQPNKNSCTVNKAQNIFS
jgi:hypothetical protein